MMRQRRQRRQAGATKDGAGEGRSRAALIGHAILYLVLGVCLLGGVRRWLPHAGMVPAANLPRYAGEPLFPHTVAVYRFAVHPLHNPRRLFANFQAVCRILNEADVGFRVRLIASRDYRSFEKRLAAREFDVALVNPLQALLGERCGYRVVAKMGDDDMFRGIIVARRDADIRIAPDMNGRTLVCPSPTALAATLMPRLYLRRQGADDVRIVYSGSQESAIMNVYLGKADAAGTWPMPWRLFAEERPEVARQVHVLWRTENLINNAVLVRDDMPPEHARRLVDVLLGLTDTAEGRAALADISLSCFEAACGAEYFPPVRAFLDEYRREFSDPPGGDAAERRPREDRS